MFTEAQEKAIVFTPMATGSLSFIASGALIIMILFFSKVKLSAVCRRVIFGLCVYDVLFSLGSALGTYPVPVGQGLYSASGNIATCDVQGFLIQLGFNGSVLYHCSLSTYYVAVVKFNMKEPAIKRKLEFWLHFFPNVVALGAAIFLLAGRYYNSIGNVCWISAVPKACIYNPAIKCIRGGTKAPRYSVWLARNIAVVGFIIVSFNMTLIIYTVLVQKCKGDRWRSHNSNRLCVFILKCFDCLSKWCENTNLCNRLRCVHISKASIIISTNNAGDEAGHSSMDPIKISSNEKLSNHYDDIEGQCLSSELGALKPKARASRSGTPDDPYKFDSRKVRSSIRRESLVLSAAAAAPCASSGVATGCPDGEPGLKPKARASRSGTPDDPYKFDSRKVRSFIRRESLVLSATAASSVVANDDIDENDESKLFDAADAERQDKPLRVNSKVAKKTKSQETEDRPTTETNEESVESEAISQALLYIGCFFITYIFPVVARSIENYGNGVEIPFFLLLLCRFFLPLNGFLTILVYTRPHVKSIRRNNPEYSWFKAFGIAFKAGGDNDSVGQSTLGQSQRTCDQRPMTGTRKKKLQDRIKKDFNRRMDEIKRKSMVSEDYLATVANAKKEIAEEEDGDEEYIAMCNGSNEADIETSEHDNVFPDEQERICKEYIGMCNVNNIDSMEKPYHRIGLSDGEECGRLDKDELALLEE